MTGNYSHCTAIPIVLMPNLEADCTVREIVPNVEVGVDPLDCGNQKTGSAFRFVGTAGEHYRLESTVASDRDPASVAMITDANGVHYRTSTGSSNWGPFPQELVIESDGTYYVIATLYATSVKLIKVSP
jgi:hypothetical protein